MQKNKIWNALFLDASGTIFRPEMDAYGNVALFSDAVAILECFRKRELAGRKIKTGLITSWGSRVHEVLRFAGVTDCFDVVVCGDDVQRTKPANEPFLLASASVGVDPSCCLHVGDSLRDDVFGAHDAGFDCLWVNRRERSLRLEENRMFRSLGHPWFADMDDVKQYLEDYMLGEQC
jgi:FMN phosphatase YigB (HAD superfamily)